MSSRLIILRLRVPELRVKPFPIKKRLMGSHIRKPSFVKHEYPVTE